MNRAQRSPALESFRCRASAEPVLRWERSDRVVSRLHKIRKVAGRRQSAKQVLSLFEVGEAMMELLPPYNNPKMLSVVVHPTARK